MIQSLRKSILLVACTAFSHLGYAEAPAESTKTFDGFPSVRAEVLSLISGSTQSIRIATDFLSDGEIVSALYIAQYRKVTVQVLLGPSKATHVLSRLSYLKAQNVPTWLRPRGFMSQYSTVIQSDQKLYALDADLDYMARHRRFTLRELPESSIAPFLETFSKAQTEGVTPEPRNMPLVGRPRPGSPVYQGQAPQSSPPAYKSTPIQPYSGEASQDGSSVFRYSRNKEKPSSGVPTKLPKSTILQQRMGSSTSQPKEAPADSTEVKEPEAVQ